MTQRSRRFTFTQFDMDFNFEKLEDESSYLVRGRETCPTTQKLHWQGYVEFDNPRTITSIIRKLKKSHVEIAKSSAAANKNYCTKEQDGIVETGIMSLPQGMRTDLVGLCDLIKDKPNITKRELIEVNPATWARNYRALQEIQDIYSTPRDWVTTVIYIWGPSGVGKTRLAMNDGATKVWFKSDFFSGYGGEDTVLFDDVDKWTFFKNRNTLLELLDRYPYRINVKGGSVNWRPKKVYITSNYPPNVTFDCSVVVDSAGIIDPAVERRITTITHLENVIEEGEIL